MNIKLGSDLMVAIETPEYLRNKSLDLNTGYDSVDKLWTLIIKYQGSWEELISDYNINGTKLLGNYGLINVAQKDILGLAGDSRVLYIEKPKLFTQGNAIINGFVESCMSVPYFDLNLRGNGITVAVIDSGIDIFHPVFNSGDNEAPDSKIAILWDQTISGNPPSGYNLGAVFDKLDIDSGIMKNSFPSKDISGHGTAVAGIVSSCTPEADLLIVKLDTSSKDEIDTINLMQGIDFSVRYALDNNLPMVINLSYGNNSGDHNGSSLVEQYLDDVSSLSKISVVVGAGNDGNSGRHAQINMGNESFYRRDFRVSEQEGGINIQLWREYDDQLDIFLYTPSGDMIGPFNNYSQLMTYNVNSMDIRVLNNGPSPINTMQETYISIIPLGDYIQAGIWSIGINPKRIINGRLDIWLPTVGGTNADMFFLVPSENTTITIPSTASNVITVGAYDSNSLSIAPFSGRGYRVDGDVKPDIVAPGVNINAPSVGGGYQLVSGTSFATPFAASSAAMLMEYGIINNNDPFLYGEKVKAYLINGAKSLPGRTDVPNQLNGWGALCVENSLP